MQEKFSPYEIAQIAIGMEEDGFAFYDKAAQFAKNDKVKAIFYKLANDEIQHKKEFSEKDFAQYFDDASDSLLELDRYIKDLFKTEIFPSIENAEDYAKKIQSDKQAIELGMEQEKRAIKFYTELKKKVTLDKARMAIDDLIREETEHYQLLKEIYDSL
ncbi:MAG: ferritin family protein [Calditrichia bacterium]